MVAWHGGTNLAPHQVDQNADAFSVWHSLDCRDEVRKGSRQHADAVPDGEVIPSREQATGVAARDQPRHQRGGQRLRAARIAQNEPGDAAGAIDRTPAGRRGIKADEEVARKERPARLPQHARPRDSGENLCELRPVFRTVCLLTLRGHFPSHIFESLFWRFVADA